MKRQLTFPGFPASDNKETVIAHWPLLLDGHARLVVTTHGAIVLCITTGGGKRELRLDVGEELGQAREVARALERAWEVAKGRVQRRGKGRGTVRVDTVSAYPAAIGEGGRKKLPWRGGRHVAA